MANRQATGKKAKRGPELVQRVRGAVLAAFDRVDQKGKLMSEVLADEFEKNPLKFLDTVSKFCPKEVAMEIEANVLNTVEEMSDEELAEDIERIDRRIAALEGAKKRATKKAAGSKQPSSVH